MSFQELPTELLIPIFEYCHIRDLKRLQRTCRRFKEIIQNSTTLGNHLLVTNQLRSEIRKRSFELLKIDDKYRISKNWKNGLYHALPVLKDYKLHLPWLILTKDHLWLSRSSTISAYRRLKNNLDVDRVCYNCKFQKVSDVCKFVLKDNYVISGHRNGNIHIWEPNRKIVYYQKCHEGDVHSVDLHENIVASGSRDKSVKIWHLHSKGQHSFEPLYNYDVGDRVWSVALSNYSSYLAAGASGYFDIPPLHIFDVNRPCLLHKLGGDLPKCSGILHMKWEGPNILLTGGYDKNIRKWDLRTGSCEQSWEDPFYSTIYCFDTDNYFSLISGTQTSGRVVLWDMRMQSKTYVQMYFMQVYKKGKFNSPIYSLAFDACNLITATDRLVSLLDFTIEHGTARDYSRIVVRS